MSDFKEHQLWDACASGHLELVKFLARDPGVNVNWIGFEKGDTPLHRACRLGHAEVVKFLLQHPNVDLNAGNAKKGTPFSLACQEDHREVVSLLLADVRIDVNTPMNEGATPFYIACQENHIEVVTMLLADPRIDVNEADVDGVTPLFMACQNGHKEVVSLLMSDLRIDLNKSDSSECTPLWFVSQQGHLRVAQVILVSGRNVDTKAKSIPGIALWNNKTAAEIGRFQEIRAREAESAEVYARRRRNGPLIAALLDSFDANPATTRQQLRELPELRDPFISDLFALVIFLCEELLTVRAEDSALSFHKAARFFQIAQALPMELQMMLCNRVFGAGKNNVLTQHSEPAFKKLGKLLALSQRSEER